MGTKQQKLSLLLFCVGAALLVAALSVGTAQSANSHVSKSGVTRGGTLNVNQSSTDFDYVDPALAYVTNDWAMLYTVQMLLVNFPEKSGAAGSEIYPEAATAFPTISKDGKTYTFHIRPGLKFSDGSPVTAAAYQRAWERILSPKMGSPLGVNDQFQNVVVGGTEFLNGKTQHISGITANGLTLTFHLTKPNPTFVSYLSMQWFGAIKPDTPYTATGLQKFPSAGPYTIQSWTPGKTLVEVRNPYYKGTRPANPDKIVWTANTDPDQSILQIKAGQSDIDASGVPATAAASLGAQYGVNKGRFFVGPTACVDYLLLDTARAPFNSLALRQAVNWGIDRPSVLSILGKYAGARTDQILVPGIPGYKPYHIYAFKGADVAKAKSVGGSAINGQNVNVIHSTSPTRTAQAQVIEYNLKQMGFTYTDVPTPGSIYYKTLETKGTTYDIARAGWCADYFDPFDYINALMDGRSIQAANNTDMSYLNAPALNKQMDQAASLAGSARAAAYAKLDLTIMKDYAPWVPYEVDNTRFFVSSRVHNWVYSTYFGYPDFNALAVS
jgi:peptide/nickel transport system substrate-binding protein